MRLPIVLILTGSILLGHAVGIPSIATAQQQRNQSPMLWKLWSEGRGWPGRNVTTNEQTYEASGRWIWITLTIQNVSGVARPTTGSVEWKSAKLEDTQGNTYDIDWGASSGVEARVDNTPFRQAETRLARLLFDIPDNAQVSKLRVEVEDESGQMRELIVNL
ncbi:MAG: DUF4352 domain-containing protein [Alkalinema sp. RU_4_3]|nr:DUF4352 domain-containing protein [Alkalinema sp. RU_4_3]